MVCIPKGFGKFDIGKESCMSKCPVCKKDVDADNFGYYGAKIIITGKLRESDTVIHHVDQVNSDSYTTFKDRDEDIREWYFIEVIAEKLEK